jgi:hypothetical protein
MHVLPAGVWVVEDHVMESDLGRPILRPQRGTDRRRVDTEAEADVGP